MSVKTLLAIGAVLILLALVVVALLHSLEVLAGGIHEHQRSQAALAMVDVEVMHGRAAQLDAGGEGQDGGGFHRFFYARPGIVNARQFS